MSLRSHRRREIIARLSEAQGHRCPYCGGMMDPDKAHAERPNAATLDHVVPRASGGPDWQFNLVAACRTCNNRRGNRWRGWIPPEMYQTVKAWIREARTLGARPSPAGAAP